MGLFGELRGLGKELWDLSASGWKKLPSDKELLRSACESEILDSGQKIIEGMRLTTGVGEPEDGDRFGQGSTRFNEVGETLTSAFPDDSWAGAGAEAYVDQNRQHVGNTNTVALLDRGVQTVLAREAYQVRYHRDKLDDQSNFLADLSYLTMPLAFIPGVGKAMKYTIEAAAVNAALGICSLELYELSRESNENAAQLQQAVGLYADVAGSVKVTGAEPAPTPPPPRGGSSPEPPLPERPTRRDEPRADAPEPAGPASSPSMASGAAPSVPRSGTAELGGAPPQAPLTEPPAAAGLPPGAAPGTDVLGQLGSLLAPLLAGTGQPPAQPAATPPVAPTTGAPQTPVGEKGPKDGTNEKEEKKGQSDDKDRSDKETVDVARGRGEGERAPVHVEVDVDPDRLQVPVTVRLDPDRPTGPRSVTTPQE